MYPACPLIAFGEVVSEWELDFRAQHFQAQKPKYNNTSRRQAGMRIHDSYLQILIHYFPFVLDNTHI